MGENEVKIIFWVVFFVVISALQFMPVEAQEDCVPYNGPGAEILDQHDGVIPPGQSSVAITWEAPLYLNNCTDIASDPLLAVTAYEIYISSDPGTPTSAATERLTPDVLEVTRPVAVQGNRMWVMFRACNAPHGTEQCGFWSRNIEKVVTGKPHRVDVTVTVNPGG